MTAEDGARVRFRGGEGAAPRRVEESERAREREVHGSPRGRDGGGRKRGRRRAPRRSPVPELSLAGSRGGEERVGTGEKGVWKWRLRGRSGDNLGKAAAPGQGPLVSVTGNGLLNSVEKMILPLAASNMDQRKYCTTTGLY
jgi:hypothetical protein